MPLSTSYWHSPVTLTAFLCEEIKSSYYNYSDHVVFMSLKKNLLCRLLCHQTDCTLLIQLFKPRLLAFQNNILVCIVVKKVIDKLCFQGLGPRTFS